MRRTASDPWTPESRSVQAHVRLARKRLFGLYIRPLLDASTIGVPLLALWTLLSLAQSEVAAFAVRYPVVAGEDGARLLAGLAAATVLFRLVWIQMRRRPWAWPEAGDVLTVAIAPVDASLAFRGLRRSAALWRAILYWFLEGVVAYVAEPAFGLSLEGWGLLLLLSWIVATLEEASAWAAFHEDKTRPESVRFMGYAAALTLALGWTAVKGLISNGSTVWIGIALIGVVLIRINRRMTPPSISWLRFSRLGEEKLSRWLALRVGMLFAAVMPAESERRISSSKVPARESEGISALRYDVRWPLLRYTALKLSRSRGTTFLLILAFAPLVTRTLSLPLRLVAVGVSMAAIASVAATTAVSDRETAPWFDLFPWTVERYRQQLIVAMGVAALPPMAFQLLLLLAGSSHSLVMGQIGAFALLFIPFADGLSHSLMSATGRTLNLAFSFVFVPGVLVVAAKTFHLQPSVEVIGAVFVALGLIAIRSRSLARLLKRGRPDSAS